nr:hypothetical protein [Tanacetum cinerariifolium]
MAGKQKKQPRICDIRVIVKHAFEFTARINTLQLPSALPKKMDRKQKKQPRIRFAVRTPPVNCKPVKKVLPCTSSVGSNDPDVILLDAYDHDGEAYSKIFPPYNSCSQRVLSPHPHQIHYPPHEIHYSHHQIHYSHPC